jgi:glycosyltransferase involved in cell wall biosynthesis
VTSVGFHVDQLFYPVPGGTGTYVRDLISALALRDPGLELTLFHSRFRPSDPPEWIHRYTNEEVPWPIATLYPRWNTTGRPKLPASLAGLNILHAPSPVAVPPRGPRQRLVVTVHDLAFAVVPQQFPAKWRAMFRLGLRAAVARADAIITPSRNTAEDLLSRTRVDAARVHVVPLASGLAAASADPDAALSKLRIPAPYILFVGKLEPRKNLVRLVRAYRRAATSGLPHALVLAGPLGWRHQTLLREIALPGPGEVILTGQVSDPDLDALYRRAEVFVYPALYEGFGLPVLEAMERGVPTIHSNASSLPEVAGDAGIGVDPRSVRSIAAALESVATDETLRERLSLRGCARAERFSWDEAARMTLDVYGGLLEG